MPPSAFFLIFLAEFFQVVLRESVLRGREDAKLVLLALGPLDYVLVRHRALGTLAHTHTHIIGLSHTQNLISAHFF